MIRMTHPDLPGQQITVPDGALNGHQRSGWVIDTDPPPPEDIVVEVAEPSEDTPRPAVARRSHTPVAGKEQ